MITHPWKVLAARTGAAVLMTVGLIVGVAGVPATAQSTPVNYTVLGDSFSAGTGGGDESGPCLQSPNGYGNVYAAATGRTLANLACFGATTEQVRNEQIPLIPTSTKLVTLTVGANDVGSGALAEACTAAPQSPACTTALASSLSQLRSLPAKIKATVKAIKAKVPTAKVVLLGYPRLFEPSNMAAAGYSPEQVSTATTMNVATDLVNGVLAVSALSHGARFVPVAWAFYGHGIPSHAPWIIFPPDASPYLFHPNATGYAYGYARALRIFN